MPIAAGALSPLRNCPLNFSSRILRSWLCALGALLTTGALAQPTALDTSFDLDGERENPFPGMAVNPAGTQLLHLGLDHEGRILIAGHEGEGLSRRGLVGRLLANGSADPAWAGSGVRVLDQRAGMDVADLIALPDGGALVCGSYRTGAVGLLRFFPFVARFRSDGQLDSSFAPTSSTPGIYFAEPAGLEDFTCSALELQSDGRTMIVGGSYIPEQGRTQPALLRLTVNGALDSSFASVGYVRLSVQGSSHAVAIAEQPGLGIAVWLLDNLSQNSPLLRMRLDGSLDEQFTTFLAGGDGQGEVWLSGNSLHLLPELKLRFMRPLRDNNLRRYTSLGDRMPNGLPDFFSSVESSGPNDHLFSNGIASAPDGTIVIASRLGVAPDNCRRQRRFLHLARRLSRGAPDLSFGGTGQHSLFPLFPVFHPSECAHGIASTGDVVLDRSGRILLASAIVQGFPNPASASPTTLRPLLTRLQGSAFGAAAWDIDPTPIAFAAASARPSTQAVSNTVTVAGLGEGVHVPAYAIGGEISRNGAAWSRLPTLVRGGDQLRVRALAPAQAGQSVTASLYVGGIRGANGWAALGPRQRADFLVGADQPALPGVRCSSSGGSNCSAAIPDNGSVESILNLVNPGSCNYITGVRVGVDLAHAYIGDLRITLTDPNGRVFIGGSEGIVGLVDRVAVAGGAPGSCGRRDIVAAFADDALRELEFACGQPLAQPGLSGDLRPAQALSQLIGRRTTGNNGASTTGAWKLLVQDLASGDSGQLHDWSLELGCSASAPALSDLGVAVSGPPSPVAGSTVNLSWTVTNQGPMATSNGRFQASLPTSLTDSLDNPAWGCSTSAGGSCTPLIPCFGACIGAEVDAALSLPVGGTATFFATGTLTELAGDGLLTVNGRAWTPLAIGGTRDANPLNDSVQYQAPIARMTDLGILSLTHAWQGQTLTVTAVVGNAGPSQSLGHAIVIDLPDGLSVQTATCDRGPLPCGGTLLTGAGNLVTLTGASVLPNRTPMRFVITATWAQPVSPGSVQAQAIADASASDPQPGNNQASQTITAPPPLTPLIFQHGFE